MKFRRNLWSTACLTVAVLGLATIATADDEKKSSKAEIGEAAPAWTLNDMKGDSHNLTDFEGKIVVLEWFNADCPFCRNVYDNGVVETTLKKFEEMGEDIVYLTVNSTNPDRVGKSAKDIEKVSARLMKNAKVELPMLLDYDGAIGKAYGARTTPHMYVIDGEGVLRYHGAFTDDRSGKKKDYKNYVVDAVKMIKADETVTPDYVQPWGCSVKYAK
ncbi:MAG: redoxin domain-containing protein [Planctomycetota bacterium]